MRKHLPVFLLLALLVVPVFFLTGDTFADPSLLEIIDDAKKRSEEMDIDIGNITEGEMTKEAEKAFKNTIKNRTEDVEAWKDRIGIKDGNITFTKKAEDNKKNYSEKSLLNSDERIYIFISSSLPLTTLTAYAVSLDKLQDPNISMVLRGCINNCSKLMPTIDFLKSFIMIDEKTGRNATVQIDPFLFGHNDIKMVPAIVFSQGVSTLQPELSEGLADNLNNPVQSYLLYGDVALDYALEKINTKARNDRLARIVKLMRKGWHENDTPAQ